MRIGELSQETGVPVATIKYYLREGLLPPGELTSPNQARYDETHVHRVRLVRVLVEIGGLSIAATREVVTLMHADGRTPLESLGKVHFALQRGGSGDSPAVAEFLARRRWTVRDTNPARAALADVLTTFDRLGHPEILGLLDTYADAAETLAAAEITALAARPGVDSMAETVVAMNILGTALLSALRGLAQESAATKKFT